jgi:hypothetical protein
MLFVKLSKFDDLMMISVFSGTKSISLDLLEEEFEQLNNSEIKRAKQKNLMK